MIDFTKFRGQDETAFYTQFKDDASCMSYLFHYKWKDGFVCSKCGCKEEVKADQEFHKRCKKCKYASSATAHTLFHKVKFGLRKAFVIVFKMSATTKSISAEQLAKNVGVNRKTALAFQHKVRLAMQSSQAYPMQGEVEVDETFIGQQEQVRGRGAQSKAQIVLAVEKNGGTGVKRVYAKVIDNASTNELKQLFDAHIGTNAKVLTDKWRGYTPVAKLFNIKQEKSEPDKNFKAMHRVIQQLKSWIRGIHHSVDQKYLQAYLNEFCYRINRSIHKETIFDNLLVRMVENEHTTIKQIKFAYVS